MVFLIDPFFRFAVVLGAALSLLSVVQNILVLIVFSRKTFQKSSFRLYFQSLAVFDMFIIYHAVTVIVSLATRVDLMNENDYGCKITYFVSIGFSPNSSWVLVMFSLDQLYRVTMSKRFNFIRKRSFQLAVLVGIFIFHIVNAIYVLTQVRVKEFTTIKPDNLTFKFLRCEYPTAKSIMPVFYILESCVIPFGLMVMTTALIIKVIIESRSNLGKYSASKQNINTAAAAAHLIAHSNNQLNHSNNFDNHQHNLLGHLSPQNPTNNMTTTTTNARTSTCSATTNVHVSSRTGRHIKFAFNSVVFNIFSIVLLTPIAVIHLYRGPENFQINLMRMKMSFFVLFALNFASHFWVHFCVNSIFRNEVFLMMKLKKNLK